MNADPAVVEHLQGPMSREASDAFIDRIEAGWLQRGWNLWAIEVPEVAPHLVPHVFYRLSRDRWRVTQPSTFVISVSDPN